MDSSIRTVGGVILKQNENKLHKKDSNVIMLEVLYSTRLKPYLLSLLLSREQRQIQQWKVFIVFEERSGRWGFSGNEFLLQLMILSRRYHVVWGTLELQGRGTSPRKLLWQPWLVGKGKSAADPAWGRLLPPIALLRDHHLHLEWI